MILRVFWCGRVPSTKSSRREEVLLEYASTANDRLSRLEELVRGPAGSTGQTLSSPVGGCNFRDPSSPPATASPRQSLRYSLPLLQFQVAQVLQLSLGRL